MRTDTLVYGELSCEVSSRAGGEYSGILKYRVFESGEFTGPDAKSIEQQFQAVCELMDQGGQVRHGIIMTGYHNGENKGNVLLLDGEVIGEWAMAEDDDWSTFTASGSSEDTLSAPSAWMLHDSIARWLSGSGEAPQ